VTLDSSATLTVMVDKPIPHKGVGLEVEIRSDFLKVIGVEPFSPAARAGIRIGDHIVAIGTQRVAHMDDEESASALSLAVDRTQTLGVTDSQGQGERELKLDQGYIWLVM
jgi:C-terminal processing protease CtpA/Prc